MKEIIEKIELTDKEKEFCELLISGDSLFAGQAEECYREVFGEVKHIAIVARKLLSKPHIASYIKELIAFKDSEMEHTVIKLQIAETLKAVMIETAKGEYIDKYGVPLSPASLRAVSVNAARALMEIYPVKHSLNENGANTSSGNMGIMFNVIVPQNIINNSTNGEQTEEQQ